jgi:hypothetical protein
MIDQVMNWNNEYPLTKINQIDLYSKRNDVHT